MFKPKSDYRCVAWSPGGDLVVFIYPGKRSKSTSTASLNLTHWCCCIWDRKADLRIQLPNFHQDPKIFFKCVLIPSLPYRVYFFLDHYTYHYTYDSYIWAEPSSHHWQTYTYKIPDRYFRIRIPDAVLYQPRDTNNSTDARVAVLIDGAGLYSPKQGPLSNLKSPNYRTLAYKRRLVPLYNQEGPEAECFLVEHKLQCAWEVWEVDISWRQLRRVYDLSGLTVFLASNYSVAYRSDSELDRNCIYFTTEEKDDGRLLNIYMFRLDDQSLSIGRTQPHLRFPFCFARVTDSGMPYLKFINKDKEINTAVVTSAETPDVRSTDSSCSNSDQSCDLAIEDNVGCKLSYDLHRLISDLLPTTMDYANFRLVCKDWSRLAPIRWQPDFSNSDTVDFPWLMLAGEKDEHACFIDPTCGMRYFISSQELLGCKIRYSNDGWLLVTQGMRTIFFFEPFSKTKIMLVDIPKHFYIDGISFSSSPSSPSDWKIIAVSCMPEVAFIARLLSDYDKWIIIRTCLSFIPCGCSPVFHRNSLYIPTFSGSLAQVLYMDPEFDMDIAVFSANAKFKFSDYCRGFLVSCGRKLYIVIIGLLGKSIKVYRLVNYLWNEVKDIDNFSFFISQTSSFAVAVTDIARRNTINFPLFDENKHVFYKLDEGEFKLHDGGRSTVDIYQRKELFNGTWLQPKVVKAYSM